MTVVVKQRQGGMRIVGSGGGGKGGGGSARTPIEYPDSAHSTSYAALLDVIGNGEMAGPAHPDAPMRDIYLDGTPIQNEDGTLNFRQVEVEYRVGTSDQEPIAGFPASSSVTPVGVEVKSTKQWTQQITNRELSAVRVTLLWPQLVKTISSGKNFGDRVGTRVDYAIDVSTAGGSFQNVLTSHVSDKAKGYARTHRIELPASESGWVIRVRRLTPDSTSDMVIDAFSVQSYAEVIDGKFVYPMTALVGVKVDAEQFQSIPARAYHWRGQIIRVPSNYDPKSRTYTGVWDGTFKRAYSNNPAWVYYDMLTSKLYGLGEHVDTSMIDRYALYQIGAYCDQMVPDGMGGVEPRFVCNVYLQSQADALRVLNDLTSVFRGMSYWANGQVVAVADKPSDAVYTYTNANVLDGVFEYTGADISTLKTVALVSWNDPTDFYRSKVEVVEDDEGVRRYGIRKTEIIAFGCTSRGQAQRVGLYHLYTSRMETGGVAFSVGLDGVIPQPGSIVKIADRNRAGRHIGGRIHHATTTSVTLDREHPANVGDKLTVNLPDGTSQTREIVAIDDRIVSVSPAFSQAPSSESAWAIDSSDLVTQQARVISVKESDGITFEVSCVLHHPGKFEAIDHGVRLDPLPVSVVPPRVQSAPANVQIAQHHRYHQGTTRHYAEVTWEAPEHAVSYDVQWRRDDGDWIQMPRTGSRFVEISDIFSGSYVVRVRAVNALDVPSLWAYSDATELDGLAGEPPRVSGLTTTPLYWGIGVSWGFPSAPNIIEYTEVRYSKTPSFEDSLLQGTFAYPTTSFTQTSLQPGAEHFFWARLVDKNGMPGAWYPSELEPGIRGVARSDAEGYNELITQQVIESALGEQLFSDIESIEDIWQQIAEIGVDVNDLGINIKEVDGKFVVVNDRLDDMTGRFDDIDKEIGVFETKIGELGGNFDELSVQLKEVDGKLVVVTDRLDDVGERFAGIDSEIDSLDARIEELAKTPEWRADKSYLSGQVVKSDGALYRALRDVPKGVPVSDASNWEKIGDYDSLGEAVSSLSARMSTAETGIDELTGAVVANSTDITQLQSSVTGLEGEVEGNSTAISQLETRVSENQSAQAQVNNALQSRLGGAESAIDVNSGAISGLRTSVEDIDGRVSSNSRDITALQSAVSDATEGLNVNSQALSELQTEVKAVDGRVTSNSESITQLQGRITDAEDNILSNATALNDLKVSVIDHDDRLESQSQSITQLQNRAQTIEGDVSGLSGALSSLETTVSSQGDSIASQGASITQLQGKLEATDGNVSGLAGALSSLETKVLTQGDTLTSQGESITALQNRADSIEGDLSGVSGALSSLQSTVTAQGSDITSHGKSITQLQSSVTSLNEEVQGNAIAIDSLETNVTGINDKIEVASKQTSVLAATVRRLDDGEGELETAMAAYENRAFIKETQEVVADNEKAVAKAISEIGARIDDNVALISEVKESVVTLESAQAQVNESLAAQVQDNASTIGNLQIVIADLESSQATINSELMSQVGANAAKVTALEQTVADDKSAQSLVNQSLQSQLNDVEAGVSGTSTAISSLSTKVESIDGKVTAQGQSISQLDTKVGDVSASVQDISQSVVDLDGRVSAARTIKVGVNSGGVQYMAGIGVGVDNSTGSMQSQVAVVADRFAVLHSIDGTPESVFSVQGGVATLNTALIGYATITEMHVAQAAIKTGHIEELAVTEGKMANLSVSTGKIKNLAVDTLKIAGNAVTVMSTSQHNGTAMTSSEMLTNNINVNTPVPSIMSITVLVSSHRSNYLPSISLYVNGGLVGVVLGQVVGVEPVTRSQLTMGYLVTAPAGNVNIQIRQSGNYGGQLRTTPVSLNILTTMR